MTPATFLHYVMSMIRVALDVVFQKLCTFRVPDLAAVGGPVKGLVALVTGPTSGIGRAVAVELGRRGATGPVVDSITNHESVARLFWLAMLVPRVLYSLRCSIM